MQRKGLVQTEQHKRNKSRKYWGFQKRQAGRVSGLLGARRMQRGGCNCCDLYSGPERRIIKRRERASWLRDWQEQRSELQEPMLYGSFE